MEEEAAQNRCDALAAVSGMIQAFDDMEDDEVSAEFLKSHFNDTLERYDVDSDVLPVE